MDGWLYLMWFITIDVTLVFILHLKTDFCFLEVIALNLIYSKTFYKSEAINYVLANT